jgi:electron transfer flavoprotein alpha subunit
MGTIFVVVEHREGEIREVTLQMLCKADSLCKALSSQLTAVLTAVLIGEKDCPFIDDIVNRVDRVIHIGGEGLEHFDAEIYIGTLKALIQEERPLLTLIGHTPWGMDIAPILSIQTGYPLASDCVDINIENDKPKVIRQIYGGKLLSKVAFKESEGYIITVRPGSFPGDMDENRQGEITEKECPDGLLESRRQFLEFIDTGAGEVDISQADFLVSIGRGIGEADHVDMMKDLATAMSGVLSCSRPVVDKGWLPKFRQVGTSGKSVKPKVYLALGISGAFQHVAGISGAGTIIAVNKDKKAPIFRVADYGVVEDLFKIAEALKEKAGA